MDDCVALGAIAADTAFVGGLRGDPSPRGVTEPGVKEKANCCSNYLLLLVIVAMHTGIDRQTFRSVFDPGSGMATVRSTTRWIKSMALDE
jgi:hypothetical protein